MNLNFPTQWVMLMAVVGLIAYCWPERRDKKAERFLRNRNPVIHLK